MSVPPSTPSTHAGDWDHGDPLIARHVEPHPHKPGVEYARISGHGYSVWILVDALRAAHDDVARVASEYDLPEDAIRAAAAFYERHRGEIDAHINDNAAAFGASF